MTVASFIKLSGSKVQRAQQGSPQVIEAGQLVLLSDCQLAELEECFITSHMSCKAWSSTGFDHGVLRANEGAVRSINSVV